MSHHRAPLDIDRDRDRNRTKGREGVEGGKKLKYSESEIEIFPRTYECPGLK